jgi:hypothetical protein
VLFYHSLENALQPSLQIKLQLHAQSGLQRKLAILIGGNWEIWGAAFMG